MTRNRKVNRSRSAKGRKRPAAKHPSRASRTPEIVGILGLGTAIFTVAALLSLQIGGGSLMGPFGRSVAVLTYGVTGLCSYLAAIALAGVSYRLLADRTPLVQASEATGGILALLGLSTLVHLIGAKYQVGGSGPGGATGEHLAEVLREVISTAGTALVAIVLLALATVFATRLKPHELLAWAGRVGGRVVAWLRAATAAVGAFAMNSLRAAGAVCGEVVRALLPERESDTYYIDEDEIVDEEYDPYELDEEEQDPAADPPIIDARSGPIPVAELDGDTEKIDQQELAKRLAEQHARSELESKGKGKAKGKAKTKTGAKSKAKTASKAKANKDKTEAEAEAKPETGAAKKKTTKKRKNTLPGFAPGSEEIEDAAPADAETAEEAENAPAPLIVESRFRKADAEEMEEKEKEVDANRLDFIPLGDGEYQLPSLNLLDFDESKMVETDHEAMLELSARLVQTLEHYGVKGEVKAIRPGPVVTMYEFAPAPGTRVNKISNLSDDLAMSLEALNVRIVAPIPGKAAVGIEVPNKSKETVYLKEILTDTVFQDSKLKLPISLGKDIEGAPTVVDLARMPHLLVAGTTGSGKSVAVNSMITSLLYHSTPEDVRMIMVDPKMLELSIYEGIPHLLLPVVTDPKKANLALRWAVDEMERRYDLLATMGVRDLSTYNKRVVKAKARFDAERLQQQADAAARRANDDDADDSSSQPQLSLALEEPPTKLPYIVVVIDEFADLMMCAAKEVETSVARIAQKARAAGIHLVLATQRPSVNVITGLIKANFPSRAAFRVTSKVDSRTILDQGGAEALLGAGDMLFSDRGAAPQRLHGCYLDEDEIHRIVEFLKTQGKPVYNMEIIKPRDDDKESAPAQEEADVMYDQALNIVAETRQVSISMIQRRLRIGYNRAARIVEYMELEGVVSPPDGTNRREVLLPPAA